MLAVRRYGWAVLAWVLIARILIFSPSTSRAQEAVAPAASETPADENPGDKIVGIYQGVTLASCTVSLLPDRCNAQQKVTITVIQGADQKLKGYYKCAYGNQICFHDQNTGKVIEATINGAEIMVRVMLPDGTGYIFNGHDMGGGIINGGYTATSGGAPLERGVWRARKVE
jgi:hypothetical protein